jgi:DNA modification methylase
VNVHAYKRVDIDSLKPWENNPRTHSQDQIKQIRRSIREFGFTNPLLIDESGLVIAGHGRVEAAKREGLTELPAIELQGLSEAQKRALVIADNQIATNAGWDENLLRLELDTLKDDEFDLSIVGFTDEELARLLADPIEEGLTDPDDVPSPPINPVTVLGDVWLLGRHRVMCGDSTSVDAVRALCGGDIRAQLLHADPPYGMGKASDGVANDNLYREELDRFQMEWWATFRTFLADNASAYIWGNAAELWRLWYRGGLAESEVIELRNEIVWDKLSVPGMASAAVMQYPTASERCLFFHLGNQFPGNVNADEFPESWEPVRAYMAQQAEGANIKPADIKRVCGVSMFSHWFTRSQFNLLPDQHYKKLHAAYPNWFQRPWADLKREWDCVKGEPTSEIQGARSYFDNAHDNMTDVWKFPRVVGEDRHGHATPKPVAIMERVMRSSLPSGGVCLEPFGGSGSTLMGAEKTGRTCYTMELQPQYVDVIVQRWQDFTGKQATLESDGRTFDEIAGERHGQ